MNEPRWTIKTREVNMGTDEIPKDNKTPIAAEELKLLCDKWNAESYVPVLSSTKLLHELPASVREKIQSYGPALPFGEEGKV